MRMREMREIWQTLPILPLDSLLGGRRPLIIAPHPDDESLGCGGLLAQCAEAGIAAQVAILTDGSHSHPGSPSFPPRRLAETRRQESVAALAKLGLSAHSLHWFGIEDTRLPSAGPVAETVIAQLDTLCQEKGCSLVFAPWGHDPHCDHEAAAALSKALGARCGYRVVNYPVWGWTLPDDREIDAPAAGFRLDIARQSAQKQAAIRAHATQYGDVIQDAPDGFTLPAALLSVFARPYETFLAS